MEKENKFTQGANPLCQDDHLWSARDNQSSEVEVNEFLYSLVRLIKPRFIVETGCYLGEGTEAMARALENNGVGQLVSCDTEIFRVEATRNKLEKAGLNKISSVVLSTGIDLIKKCGAMTDFAFIDSSPYGKDRLEEIQELLKHLRPNKMFALHDTAPQHQEISPIVKKIDLAKVYFNTPRGLTLFQNK